MAMETKVVTVTPEMAREWLTYNMKGQRNVMRSTVHSYARQMRNGTWRLTHQGIAFDELGELIDGQHRLNAVIEANIPVKMNVTYNVRRNPGEVFTIDMGRKRTYANIVAMSEVDDPVYKYMGVHVAAYILYKLPGSRRADPAEIMDYIERHYDDCAKLLEYCGTTNGKHTHRIPGIVGAAVLAAIYRGESENALRHFCAVYRLNDISGCEGYNPKYALNIRDYVKQYKQNSEVYNRIESSIYAFAHNLSHFRVRENCYPLNAALDQ